MTFGFDGDFSLILSFPNVPKFPGISGSIILNREPQLSDSKPTDSHPRVKGSSTGDPRWHGRCHHFYENNSRCANTNARLYCTFCSESEKDKAAIKIFCNGHMDEHIQNCQSRA